MSALRDDVVWLVTGAVVGAAVGLLVVRRVRGSWHRPVAIALACAHLGAVLGVTLLPLGAGTVYEGVSNVSLEPFRTVRMLLNGSQSGRQLGGNFVLLAPMGVLVPIAWRAARPWRRTLAWGLLVSVTIELGQLGVNALGLAHRVVDVDDVLLNVLGVAAGRLVFEIGWGFWRLVTRGRRTQR